MKVLICWLDASSNVGVACSHQCVAIVQGMLFEGIVADVKTQRVKVFADENCNRSRVPLTERMDEPDLSGEIADPVYDVSAFVATPEIHMFIFNRPVRVSPYYCLERIPEGATHDFTIDVLIICTFDFAPSLLLDTFDKYVALFQI